jgi:hypothetical protein
MSAPASREQIDRLYEVIDRHTAPGTHGGDILDMVRDAVGRPDLDNYWELTGEEIELVVGYLSD